MPTDRELDAVRIIAAADNPRNPPCPGPLAIHQDGTIACLSMCEGIMLRFHGDDAPTPCNQLVLPLDYWRCERCRG